MSPPRLGRSPRATKTPDPVAAVADALAGFVSAGCSATVHRPDPAAVPAR
ncbi:MAG: hypothetical protein R3A52_27175 [Polyangiales bacterium]